MKKRKKKKVWWTKAMKLYTWLVEKWAEEYLLSNWVIIVRFSETPSVTKWEEEKDTLADCTPDTVYSKATITFYPEILKWKYCGWYIENCVKHEVCHLLTAKISDLAIDRYSTEKQIEEEIEALTQKISVITK